MERASKSKKKLRRRAGRRFPLHWRLQYKSRWLFFRWKLDHDRKDKKYVDEDRPSIRKYVLKLARSASRGRRVIKKIGFRVKRRIYRRVKPRLHSNYLKKAGFSGGTSRYFLVRHYAAKFHMRRIYEQQFIPDEDGYLGFLKMANKLIKRKMQREQFKVRRQIPSPIIGRY